MHDANEDQRRVIDWLEERDNLLLLAHQRPDGDAYGSLFGLLIALRDAGKNCWAYLKKRLPRRYENILPVVPGVYVGTSPALPVGATVCLDVTQWDRVDAPAGIDRRVMSADVCVIDHHPDNSRFGDVIWVDPGKAATAQMIACLLRDWGIALSAEAATCLLAGMIMDTGGFRFPNTDASVLQDAAFLVDAGARYSRVMHSLFMREPYARRLLEAKLLERARFAHDGRLIYAVLTRDVMRELKLPPEDTEGLIDPLRGIEGVDIACLIQVETDHIRFSFRSHKESLPVNEIAHELGGGGHVMAAGAQVPGLTVAEAEEKLLLLTRRALDND